jgi:succinate dehydrogenase hydrophobic anchor subunit
MVAWLRSLVVAAGWIMQRVTFVILALFGLGSLAYTLGCAFGYMPWLDMTATFGGVAYPQTGQVVQVSRPSAAQHTDAGPSAIR